MLIKQIYGIYIAIGGQAQEVYDRWLSLYNWNGLNGEMLELSDTFKYFLIEEDKYVHTRTVVFCNHWPWKYKGKPGSITWKLANARAKRELAEIKLEDFLSHSGAIEINEFNTGWIPPNLDSINLERHSVRKEFNEHKI